MSNYTTQIRYICESKSGLDSSTGFNGIMQTIENSVDSIFNFDWPIFDEGYRVPLEVKILRHFYTREIGEETFGLWQLRLCDRLNVIMPYYNQLYKSELIKFNPLYDVDLTTEHERANDGLVDKAEHGDYTNHETRNRDATRNGSDDGISDTDSIGTLNSDTTTQNKEVTQNTNDNMVNEESNSVNNGTNTSNETGKSNSKNWGSTLNQGTSNNSSSNSSTTNSSENSNANSKNWGSNVTNSTVENNGTKDGKNVNRFSDTPQGEVNIGGGPNDGNPSAESVFGNGYLTNVTIVDEHGDTTDKSKSASASDETTEGVVNQTVGRNESLSGSTNQSGKTENSTDETSEGYFSNDVDKSESMNSTANNVGSRTESGIQNGSKNDTGSVVRDDTKKDKINVHTSNVYDSNENEKIVGNGTRSSDIVGKIKNLSTEDFIQRITGKRGGLTYSKMLDEFRKTFLNIDRMILNDLDSLFLGLWE